MFEPTDFLAGLRRLWIGFFLFGALFGPSASAQQPPGATMPDTLEITGIYIGKGVECPQFRLPDGEQISLEGSGFDRLPVGTALALTGRFIDISICMQGRTFLVSASAPAVSAP